MSGHGRSSSPGFRPNFINPLRKSDSGSMATKSAPSSGPVVNRRIGGSQSLGSGSGSNNNSNGNSPGLPPPGPPGRANSFTSNGSQRLKPSVRQTIESMVSTGSQSEYFKPEQAITLFDWDDTLCPSNWIRENRPVLSFFKPAPADEKFQKPLRELQKHVEAVLKLALKLGKVIIVTNAMEPWVETSCRNFLPQLMPYVLDIPVIYARSIFDAYNCEQRARQAGTGAIRAASGTRNSGQALPGLY